MKGKIFKDCEDPNPLIRALAVRTMGCIRVDKVSSLNKMYLNQKFLDFSDLDVSCPVSKTEDHHFK